MFHNLSNLHSFYPFAFAVVWDGTVPRIPPCSLQPPQPQRHPAHHPQAAAVWWPGWSARGCALHSPPAARRKTIRSQREHRFGPSPVLPRGVRILQLCDRSGLPVTRVPLPELVWERTVLASAVGLGALPEDWPQQVCREQELWGIMLTWGRFLMEGRPQWCGHLKKKILERQKCTF